MKKSIKKPDCEYWPKLCNHQGGKDSKFCVQRSVPCQYRKNEDEDKNR